MLFLFMVFGFSTIGYFFYRMHLRFKTLEKDFLVQRKSKEKMAQDIRTLCATVLELGRSLDQGSPAPKRRQARLGQEAQHTQTHYQMKSSAPTPEMVQGGYAHAAKLIEKGATIEELQESCGLTRQEAEMLLILHRR
jgi:hypothetical protein